MSKRINHDRYLQEVFPDTHQASEGLKQQHVYLCTGRRVRERKYLENLTLLCLIEGYCNREVTAPPPLILWGFCCESVRRPSSWSVCGFDVALYGDSVLSLSQIPQIALSMWLPCTVYLCDDEWLWLCLCHSLPPGCYLHILSLAPPLLNIPVHGLGRKQITGISVHIQVQVTIHVF